MYDRCAFHLLIYSNKKSKNGQIKDEAEKHRYIKSQKVLPNIRKVSLSGVEKRCEDSFILVNAHFHGLRKTYSWIFCCSYIFTLLYYNILGNYVFLVIINKNSAAYNISTINKYWFSMVFNFLIVWPFTL